MVFNNDSNGQDLCTLCDDMVNTTVYLYPLVEKARAANKTNRMVWAMIFDAYGGWQYDDSNNIADLPIATTILNVGQSDYDIPSAAITIRDVEIFPSATSTIYQKLIEITQENITELGLSEASIFTSTGVPRYYRPIGSSIKLYPAPNYTLAASLRVTFDRGSTSFLPTGSDTRQPGFASEFHEVISVGMALEYARRNALSAVQDIQADMNGFISRIKAYYNARFQEKFPGRLNVYDATSEYI